MKTIKEIIHRDTDRKRINLKVKNKTQISVKSAVPVKKIQLAKELIDHDLLLKPSTVYSIDFNCDRIGDVEISLGGSNAVTYTTSIGFNKLSIKTPAFLSNNDFIIKGLDIKINKVKIIETEDTIPDYFEGLLSVYDYNSKNKLTSIKIRTSNNDKEDVSEFMINEPLRSTGKTKDKIIKSDDKWVIERNCFEENLRNNEWESFIIEEGYFCYFTKLKNNPYKEKGNHTDFICDKYMVDINGEQHCYINTTQDASTFIIVTNKNCTLKDFDKDITLILPLQEKRFEELSNKLEAYTFDGSTRVQNNSLIPCKMNIKNHGFDIRNLNPQQLHTAVYNSDNSFTMNINGQEYTLDKGLNKAVVTSPNKITDNDIVFYGKDVKLSDFSLLEGEKFELPEGYVKRLESSYESEIINSTSNINYGKYRVYLSTNQRSKTLYIDEPLREDDIIYTDNKDTNTTVLKRVTGQTVVNKDVTISIWNEYNKNYADYIGFCLEGFDFNNALESKSLLLNEYFPSHTLSYIEQIEGEHIAKVYNKIYLSIKASRLKSRDIEGLKAWLKDNPFAVIYQLDKPIITMIGEERLQLQLKENSKVSTISNVPVEYISFNSMQEFNLSLKPSTQYRITFTATANAMINDFYCAGVELQNINVRIGQNTFLIRTPETIENNTMIINGQGFNIFNVMITEGETIFDSYFEDMTYLGVLTEDNKYLIKVNDKEYLFDKPLRSSRDKMVFDILRYDYNTDKVIIERNINDNLAPINTITEETDMVHDDLCLTTNDSTTDITFVTNIPVTAHVMNRGYRINKLDGIETHTIVIDGEGDIKAKINSSTASSSTGSINIIAPVEQPEQKLCLYGKGAHTNSVMIIKGKDVNTNGYFKGVLSCFEDNKIEDSFNKNNGKFIAKFVVEGEEYLYNRTLYLNAPLRQGNYLERRSDGIYHVLNETSSYMVSSDDFVLDIFENSKLKVNTTVPLTLLTTTNYEEVVEGLKPETRYIIKFVSNRNGVLEYVDLGGKKIENAQVVAGLNTLSITTSEVLTHNSIIFDGMGLGIKEVIITEYQSSVLIDDIRYFEGTKSSYETEYNDLTKKYNAVVSLSSKNLFNGLYNTVNVGGSVYYYTEYIPIDGYKKYVSNIIEDDIYKGQLFLYDKNKNQLFTETIDTLIKTNYESYPTNSNIRYLQIRFLEKYNDLQIEEGTTPTELEEYFNHTVTLQLSAPLKKEDKIVFIDNDMYHYHNENKQYEKVFDGILKLKSAPNVKLKTISSVPINTVSTVRYEEDGIAIVPNSTHLLKFNADKNGVLNFINFGGFILRNVIVNEGTNLRIINTPENVTDKLIIDGQGISLSNMIISPNVDPEVCTDVTYFEGTKSSYEDKQIVIKSISENGEKEDFITIDLTEPLKDGEVIEFRLYGVYHIHLDGYEEKLNVNKDTLEIFNRCTIKTFSGIPIRRITSKVYEQKIFKLKSLTNYILRFNASNATILDITLGGANKQIMTLRGINEIEIQTPLNMTNNILYLSAQNLVLTDVILTEDKSIDMRNLEYFDSMQSVFETKEVDMNGVKKYQAVINVSNEKGYSKDYTVYLSSPLLNNDALEWDGESLKHYHNSFINEELYVVEELESPYYEMVTVNAPLLDIPSKSVIRIKSNVPIQKFATISNQNKSTLDIKPNKEYLVLFDSSNDGVIEKISLGGGSLRNKKVVKGENRIVIRTPEELESYFFEVTGSNARLTNILIIENVNKRLKEEIQYFKNIKHTFDEKIGDKYKAEVYVVSYDNNDTFHIDKKEFLLNTPLSINDRITCLNDSLWHIHNSRIVTLDGYERWKKENDLSNDSFVVFSLHISDIKGDILIADRFAIEDISDNVNYERIWYKDSYLYMSIDKHNIEKNNITAYLENNPVTIVYDLKQPYQDKIGEAADSLLEMEKHATLHLDSFIPCKQISFSYNTNSINIKELNDAASIMAEASLDILAQTWETDYRLSEVEWMLQSKNILLTSLRSSSMLVMSRYLQAKRLIENNMHNKDTMEIQIDRYYEKKELSKEEYLELKEILN